MDDLLTRALADLREHPDSSALEIARRLDAGDRAVFRVLDNAAYSGKCQRWRGTSGPWRWEIPPMTVDELAAEDMIEGLTAAVETNARILAARDTATIPNRKETT